MQAGIAVQREEKCHPKRAGNIPDTWESMMSMRIGFAASAMNGQRRFLARVYPPSAVIIAFYVKLAELITNKRQDIFVETCV